MKLFLAVGLLSLTSCGFSPVSSSGRNTDGWNYWQCGKMEGALVSKDGDEKADLARRLESTWKKANCDTLAMELEYRTWNEVRK